MTENNNQIIIYQNNTNQNNTNQEIRLPDFKDDLELVTNKKVKNPSRLKMLHAKTQTFIQLA